MAWINSRMTNCASSGEILAGRFAFEQRRFSCRRGQQALISPDAMTLGRCFRGVPLLGANCFREDRTKWKSRIAGRPRSEV